MEPLSPQLKLSMMLPALMALGGGDLGGLFAPSRKFLRGSKEHCRECGDKIPPGKAGRCCLRCRETNLINKAGAD